MTFNQLRYFVEVCKAGSITKASRELLVSQPAISNSIQLLEEEFGFKLFERVNKHLYLTTAGKTIYEHAEDVLASVERLNLAVKNSTPDTFIHICASPVVSLMCYAPLFQAFSTRHAHITLDIHEHGSLKSLELVSQQKTDLALLALKDNIDDDLEVLPFSHTSVVYTVSKSHHLAHLPSVSIEQLIDEPLILMNPTFYQTGVLVQERFQQAGINPANCRTLNQIYLINQIIQEGHTGAFLLEAYSRKDPNLVGIPLEPAITIDIGLVWKKNAVLRNAVLKFIDFTREVKSFIDPPLSLI